MLRPNQIDYLRTETPDTLVAEYASYCKDGFDPDGTPVIIPARKGSQKKIDLPATLITLANNNVMPYVIPNGPDSDEPAAIGLAMGARVLPTPSTATKTAALQLGVQAAVEEEKHQFVLFVDADALVLSQSWAAVMKRKLQEINRGKPAMVSGLILFDHGGEYGQTTMLDHYRSARKLMIDGLRTVKHKPPMMNGANMGLYFDPEGLLYSNYSTMNPELSMRVDLAVQDLVAEHSGGTGGQAFNPAAMVMSRGDRFQSFREYRAGNRDAAQRAESYARDYGSVRTPYDGTNLFRPLPPAQPEAIH